MAVQGRQDNDTAPFILTNKSLVKTGTIAQDAARADDLLNHTVMAYNATNENWVPFTALADTEGESIPRGIYLGDDIDAADLVDGDIDDCSILVGNAIVDRDQVVWDQDLQAEDSIVAPGTVEARTAEQALRDVGIFMEDTIAISEYEN